MAGKEMFKGLSLQTAREDLEYIRRTLDAAGRFTAVSGAGLIITGLLALAAAWVNLRLTGAPWEDWGHPDLALGVWGGALGAAILVGVCATLYKAQRTGQVLWSPLLRKVLWGLCPTLLLGGFLTVAVVRAGRPDFLSGIWLGCYGAAVTAGGVMSVAVVRWMGVAFLLLGAAALWAPPSAGLGLLAMGFGFLHLAFGAYIAWRHDG